MLWCFKWSLSSSLCIYSTVKFRTTLIYCVSWERWKFCGRTKTNDRKMNFLYVRRIKLTQSKRMVLISYKTSNIFDTISADCRKVSFQSLKKYFVDRCFVHAYTRMCASMCESTEGDWAPIINHLYYIPLFICIPP